MNLYTDKYRPVSALQLFGTAESLLFLYILQPLLKLLSFAWGDLMTRGVRLMTLTKIVSGVQSLCPFFLKTGVKAHMWSKYFYLNSFLNYIKSNIPRQNKSLSMPCINQWLHNLLPLCLNCGPKTPALVLKKIKKLTLRLKKILL